MSNIFGRLLKTLFGVGKAWWIEIKTSQPNCTYYFGPFEDEAEAEKLKGGYIEDLELEGAQNIRATMMLCSHPESLTISEEVESPFGSFTSPAFSSQ